MKARHIIGSVLQLFMWPFLLLGAIAWWVRLYVSAGWEMGEVFYEWVEEKLGD